jgi:hypothetical protein
MGMKTPDQWACLHVAPTQLLSSTRAAQVGRPTFAARVNSPRKATSYRNCCATVRTFRRLLQGVGLGKRLLQLLRARSLSWFWRHSRRRVYRDECLHAGKRNLEIASPRHGDTRQHLGSKGKFSV